MTVHQIGSRLSGIIDTFEYPATSLRNNHGAQGAAAVSMGINCLTEGCMYNDTANKIVQITLKQLHNSTQYLVYYNKHMEK